MRPMLLAFVVLSVVVVTVAAADGGDAERMVLVPAGAFVMGSDFGEDDERPAHAVEVGAFRIDRDEVTVGEYRACVAAGRCQPPRRAASEKDDKAGERLPVTWVSWRDAAAYCAFVGKRLPTEAEWEKAARGGDGRRFPWGDDVDCARGNFGSYRGEGRCPDAPGRPVAVGGYPSGASPYGVRDLAGNVWEWVADAYDPRFYARSPRANPINRAPAASSERRVLRGGACCSMFGLPRAANRLAFPPDYTDDDIGFRCAVDARR